MIMKHFIFSILLVAGVSSAVAQRSIIDTSVLSRWPTLGNRILLSDDGNFVAYIISRYSEGRRLLVIQHVSSPWKREYIEWRSRTFYFG